MRIIIATALPLCQAVLLMSFAGAGLSPLAAQEESISQGDSSNDRDRAHGSFHIDTVLYQGALVHDVQWVMTRGTINNQ